MDKSIQKLYYNSIKKPVWIKEKEHKRGVRTPTSYRYGKHWEGSSGMSMELLKRLRNNGIDYNKIDFNKGGYQQGLYIY